MDMILACVFAVFSVAYTVAGAAALWRGDMDREFRCRVSAILLLILAFVIT